MGLSTYYVLLSSEEDANAKYDFSSFKGKIVIGTEHSNEDKLIAVREGVNVSYTSSLTDVSDLNSFFIRTSIPRLPIWN